MAKVRAWHCQLALLLLSGAAFGGDADGQGEIAYLPATVLVQRVPADLMPARSPVDDVPRNELVISETAAAQVLDPMQGEGHDGVESVPDAPEMMRDAIAASGVNIERPQPKFEARQMPVRPGGFSVAASAGPGASDAAIAAATSNDAAKVAAAAGERTLRQGERLSVSVSREPGTAREIEVGSDGKVHYLFDVEAVAVGKTRAEVAKVLNEQLALYYRNPKVNVSRLASSSSSVTVAGLAGCEGAHEIEAGQGLRDFLASLGALSAPGGSAKPAAFDLVSAFVARGGEIVQIDFANMAAGQAGADAQLQPGDFVYLPPAGQESSKVAVLGQVRAPAFFNASTGDTFLKAIAQAGGLTDGAYGKRCFLIRGGLKEPREILPIDQVAIASGKAADPELAKGDVVYVPGSSIDYVGDVMGQVVSKFRDASAVSSAPVMAGKDGELKY